MEHASAGQIERRWDVALQNDSFALCQGVKSRNRRKKGFCVGMKRICDNQPRLHRQRAGDPDPLPLPAAELMRVPVDSEESTSESSFR